MKKTQTRCKRFAGPRESNERGSVLAEMGLIAPFLFFLIFAIVDISMAAINYMMLQQAAREGVRAAGRMVEFNGALGSEHTSSDNADTLCNMVDCSIPGGTCGGPPAPVAECAHVSVQARVREIVTFQGLLNMEGNTVSVRSMYIPDDENPLTTAPEEDTVYVQIDGQYNGILLNTRLRTGYEGPFMFQRG